MKAASLETAEVEIRMSDVRGWTVWRDGEERKAREMQEKMKLSN